MIATAFLFILIIQLLVLSGLAFTVILPKKRCQPCHKKNITFAAIFITVL